MVAVKDVKDVGLRQCWITFKFIAAPPCFVVLNVEHWEK